jgi:hypothetical protein
MIITSYFILSGCPVVLISPSLLLLTSFGDRLMTGRLLTGILQVDETKTNLIIYTTDSNKIAKLNQNQKSVFVFSFSIFRFLFLINLSTNYSTCHTTRVTLRHPNYNTPINNPTPQQSLTSTTHTPPQKTISPTLLKNLNRFFFPNCHFCTIIFLSWYTAHTNHRSKKNGHNDGK